MNHSHCMKSLLHLVAALALIHSGSSAERPNILFLFSDDHALKAISAYGGPLAHIAPTPHIDRLAKEGAVFENSFCANSICGPSRACIQTGKHSHKNGFLRNGLKGGFDSSQWTISKALQASGYTTAVIGKWHLQSDPVGFDHWEILPGQGAYYNPDFIQMDGSTRRFPGYATDVTTDKAIAWLEQRDKKKPFFLMCQHKAPHRTFAPALRHLDAFAEVDIPEPESLFDHYENRSKTLAANEMEIDRHFDWAYDAKLRKDERMGVELKPDRYSTPEYRRMTPEQRKKWDAHFGPLNRSFIEEFKAGKLSDKDVVRWKYQRYMRNYLGTVKAVDESVGRMLAYLEEHDRGLFIGSGILSRRTWMVRQTLDV